MKRFTNFFGGNNTMNGTFKTPSLTANPVNGYCGDGVDQYRFLSQAMIHSFAFGASVTVKSATTY